MHDPREHNGFVLLLAALTIMVGVIALVLWHDTADAFGVALFDAEYGDGISSWGPQTGSPYFAGIYPALSSAAYHDTLYYDVCVHQTQWVYAGIIDIEALVSYSSSGGGGATANRFSSSGTPSTQVCWTGSDVNNTTFTINSSYWLNFQMNGWWSGNTYTWGPGDHFRVADGGTPPPPVIPTTTNSINSISPLDGSTTASTLVPISIGYNVAATSTFDQIVVMLSDITTGYTNLPLIIAPTTAGSSQTFATTTTLTSGHAYSIQAILQSSYSGAQLYGRASACNATAGASNCIFAVESNPLGTILGINAINSSSTMLLATSTCSITNISGCFQNALVWALYPSQDALNNLATTSNQLKNTAPFGYLFVNLNAISALNASSTAAVTLMTLAPITTYIFHPLDVGLSSIFGFIFLVWFIKRVRAIQL
jgi:hypothetical protein